MQVKVWLGDNQDHYYVLSRFLISRMLTVTKVPMNKVRAYFSRQHPWPQQSTSVQLGCQTMLPVCTLQHQGGGVPCRQ